MYRYINWVVLTNGLNGFCQISVYLLVRYDISKARGLMVRIKHLAKVIFLARTVVKIIPILMRY